eukprot:jgi/Picre1/32609/NNA_007955.t1
MGQYKVDINGEIIQNRNRDAHGPPKLLGLVLGRDKVTSLREFLLRIARTRPEASRLSVTLQGPNDHPSYQRLLDTTWCYLTPGSADLEAGFSLKQSWSQAQLIGRAIETLLYGRKGRKNVLMFGYGKKSSSARGKSVEGAHRTEMYCIDGTAKSMCSPAWQLLQTRIGDTLMLYLLLHGVVSRHRKRMKLMKNGVETNAQDAGGVHQGTKAAKPGRPSSWQRKKYKRAKERGDESTVRELELQRDVKHRKHDGQQLNTAVSSLHQTRESRDSRKSTRKIEHYRHPKYVLRPSEMIIPRQSMFYSRRYSRQGGLPSEHIIMRLNPDNRSGKVLYQYIFKRRLNPVALLANRRKSMHLQNCPYRPLVPPKHQYLIPWLNSIVRRAHKCNYNALLNVHCPLPDAYLKWIAKGSDRKARGGSSLAGVGNHALGHAMSTGTVMKADVQDELLPQKAHRNGTLNNQDCNQDDDVGSTGEEIPDLSASFVPHSNVANFVWAVIRAVIPKHMLGGKKSRKILRKSVHRFIGLKRFEDMTAHEVIRGIPLSEMQWLNIHRTPTDGKDTKGMKSTFPPNSLAFRTRMLLFWVGWLFGSFVVPILRSHFYCTENESYRQQVFYYRKQVWSTMIDKSFKESLSSTFIPIKAKVARASLAKRKLGVSRLRFLPKRNGLRFLVNMSRKSEARFKSYTEKDPRSGRKYKHPAGRLHFEPINQTLRKAQIVLKSEAMRHPTLFGSSMYGVNDIFCHYKPFVNKWRSDRKKEAALKSTTVSRLKEKFGPYAVCVDVSRAFDNVDVSTLLGIISELLTAEEYTIVKFTEIVTIMGEIKIRFRNFAVPTHEMHDGHFSQKMASLSNGQKSRIFVDAITEERISRYNLMAQLKDYLSLNLVKLKKKWRYQCKGIAQGGTPSTMLCSLYLGYVERACLEPMIASCGAIPVISNEDIASSYNFSSTQNLTSLTALGLACGSRPSVQKPAVNFQRDNLPSRSCPDRSHSLLLRLVDDWIIISRHRAVVEQFASRILSGIPGFNIHVNPSKTQLTFDLTAVAGLGMMKRNEFVEADGSRFIKWCGLLIDTSTLEMRADYTRYAGEHMGASLNVPAQRNPGSALSSKLCHYIRPKLIPVLLDEEINSPLTIRINVYQTFLLGAMKLHCFMHRLPCPPDDTRSCQWIISAIETGIRYAIESTRARRVADRQDIPEPSCNPSLPHSHVEF